MSEQPAPDNVVDINEYRRPREGTQFGLSQDEEQLDFRKYTGSPYDREQIAKTLAAVKEKKANPSYEETLVQSMAGFTNSVIAARSDKMQVVTSSQEESRVNVWKKGLSLLVGNVDDLSYLKLPKGDAGNKLYSERALIQMESNIGSELFGTIPKGHRREFFCLDATTYIWHESVKDANGKNVETTTRYELQGSRVLKAQSGARYSYIEGDELKNLSLAVEMYHKRVLQEVYHKDPQATPAAA